MKKIFPIKIAIITGTRPELIKLSVLIKLIEQDPELNLLFIHSGQHYDRKMFEIFLNELDLPSPKFNMYVGSHPNSVQTGKMLIQLYDIINDEQPDIIIAQGDTNTVFAAALTAFKNFIPFGHVEAGIRSFDMNMPEEINRMLTGVCTRLNFAPTSQAVENLLNEGINPKYIHQVGNTIVDALNRNLHFALEKSDIMTKLQISPNQKYIVLTVHRLANISNEKAILNIFSPLLRNSDILIFFPAHPNTLKHLKKFNLLQKLNISNKIRILEPLGYLDMLVLLRNSYFILTDSGGIQEEAFILKKPCLTLRNNTERPESVELGGNLLIGNNPKRIDKYVRLLWNDEQAYTRMIPTHNLYGDGTSSKKIIEKIKNLVKIDNLKIPSIKYSNKIHFQRILRIEDNLNNKKIREIELIMHCEVIGIYNDLGRIELPNYDYKVKIGDIIKIRC